MKLKWPKENCKAQYSHFSVFVDKKSILRHYYIQDLKDRILIRVYKINRERITYYRRLISVKVKKF